MFVTHAVGALLALGEPSLLLRWRCLHLTCPLHSLWDFFIFISFKINFKIK